MVIKNYSTYHSNEKPQFVHHTINHAIRRTVNDASNENRSISKRRSKSKKKQQNPFDSMCSYLKNLKPTPPPPNPFSESVFYSKNYNSVRVHSRGIKQKRSDTNIPENIEPNHNQSDKINQTNNQRTRITAIRMKKKLKRPKLYVDCPMIMRQKQSELPKKYENEMSRSKMTPKQWRDHLTHLEYLAYPKPKINEAAVNRGRKIPLQQLKGRLDFLAQPKLQTSRPSNASTGCSDQEVKLFNVRNKKNKSKIVKNTKDGTEVTGEPVKHQKKQIMPLINVNEKKKTRIEYLSQPKRFNPDANVNKQKKRKQEKRRELRLKRFWRSPKATSSEESTGYDSPTRIIPFINDPLGVGCSDEKQFNLMQPQKINSKPTCSLPLLQVWPSQDSPRGEADGSSFIFPAINEDMQSNQQLNSITSSNDAGTSSSDTSHQTTVPTKKQSNNNSSRRRHSLYCDTLHAGDSGIDSVQASPSPNALPCPPGAALSASASPSTTPTLGSPNLSHVRRKSSALLHPDHARLFALRMQMQQQQQQHALTSPDQTSLEDMTEFNNITGSGLPGSGIIGVGLCTASSSTTSSLTSIAAASLGQTPTQRVSDPWLQPQSDREQRSNHRHPLERRRSSTMTARYSLFDALDLEYALLRAAARGSVGPYSLSESIHKLTFTQSLAFPALARGLATKRCNSNTQSTTRPLNPNESGLNTFAKVITALVLVMVSFLVFLIVYKFVKT